MGTIEFVGGIEVKVTVGMGVAAGVAVASGIQETKTIASKTMISFFVSIFLRGTAPHSYLLPQPSRFRRACCMVLR